LASVGTSRMLATASRWSVERVTLEHVQFNLEARGCEARSLSRKR
jgi:hypothetical protein